MKNLDIESLELHAQNIKDYGNKYDGWNEEDQLCDPQRYFFIRSYNDIDSIYSTLVHKYSSAIDHMHIIAHNSDQVKGYHCHLMLKLRGATTPSAVWKWFSSCVQNGDNKGVYGNTYVQIPRNKIECYQYLIHANDDDKEPYDPLMIRHYGNPKECMDCIGLIPQYSKQIMAYNDYKNGMPNDMLINKYGKDFLYHITQYQKCVDEEKRYSNLKGTLKILKDIVTGVAINASGINSIISCQFLNPDEISGNIQNYKCISINMFEHLRENNLKLQEALNNDYIPVDQEKEEV